MEDYIWPEITKDTPLEEAKRIHQRIWDYVIEHGKKPPRTFEMYCFGCSACHYALLNTDDHDYYNPVSMIDDFGNFYKVHDFCYNCPMKWPNNQQCPSTDSIFQKWLEENDPSNKVDIAKQIRDLPWKFEMETDDET